MTRPSIPRRGAAAIWALVVLAVLTAVTAVAVKEFTATRRALDAREARAQAEWLARSGCELAVARLLADPAGYGGEVVSPVPGSEVRVAVTKAADDTFRVECQAAHPAAGGGTVVRVVRRAVKRVGGADAPRVEVVGP